MGERDNRSIDSNNLIGNNQLAIIWSLNKAMTNTSINSTSDASENDNDIINTES